MPPEHPAAPLESVRRRLEAVKKPDEVLSPLDPRGLMQGSWRGPDPLAGWPEHLRAGVLEARQGYRFRPENLALAALLEGTRAERLLDLGAGSGSLLLLAHAFTAPRRAIGLERQPQAAERLGRTLQAHGLPGLEASCADLREEATHAALLDALGGPADLIVTNPPFYPAAWGRPSPHPETHASTHALHGDAAAFLAAAARLLAPAGRACVVFDATRLHDLLPAVTAAGLRLRQLAWIPDQRPDHHHLATRCWLELGREGAAVWTPPGA